jgi:signal transduction histidine kinase
LDDDNRSHAEWHNLKESAAAVTPGDHLLVEWNEAFSMGVGDITAAHYQKLREGNYRFRAGGFDVLGNPTGANASMAVFVPPPFWRMSWFWSVIGAVMVVAAAGAGRYVVWQRMRGEMLRLKSEQALEKERLRIAQDLHDDFGARVTEISIASALARKNPGFPATAGADFDRISSLSRALVSALYETVWAINPENDNLDALGNYLCQMANNLCEQAQLPCRLQGLDLPQNIQVSSHMRHNITMAVKEAVHNVVKHAAATELTLRISYEEKDLAVSIQDNGRGFALGEARGGNGLTNMKRRLADIGGTCEIESRVGSGTTVHMRLRLPAGNSIETSTPAAATTLLL